MGLSICSYGGLHQLPQAPFCMQSPALIHCPHNTNATAKEDPLFLFEAPLKAGGFRQALCNVILRKSRTEELKALNTLFHLIITESNEQIKQACYKSQGYFWRLYSNESWNEWLENRTYLGRIVSLFKDYLAGRISDHYIDACIGSQTILKAEGEAKQVLNELGCTPKFGSTSLRQDIN